MFIIVYSWDIRSEYEQSFIKAWSRLTTLIYDNHGSLGSRLHKAEDGSWCAYAQWPDKASWQKWQDCSLTHEESNVIEIMKSTIERERFRIFMAVVEDQLS